MKEFTQFQTDSPPKRGGPWTSNQPTPYSLSPLAGSAIEKEALEGPDAFYGARLPHYAIERECATHRQMVLLRAKGLRIKEIAEITHRSAVTVSNVLRQPWAQKRITELLQESGKSALEAIFNDASAKDVAAVFEEVALNPEARNSDRIAAANAFLDRKLGKPNQPLSHGFHGNLDEMTDEQLVTLACGGTQTATT